MQPRHYDFELDADGYQFYLLAEGLPEDASPLDPSPEETARMLAVADGVVAVGTARFGDVPVTVEIVDDAPAADFEAWDHVVECGIYIASETLLVTGGTDFLLEDAKRVEISPGSYCVRVSYGGLSDIPDDLVSPGDRYRVQLWPGAGSEARVVKQLDAATAARMP